MSPETRQMLPLSSIEVSESALRGPQTQTEDFKELTESIRNEGIYQNLIVRPSTTAEGMYTLIDGLQRFTVAGLLGIEEVPVLIADADEEKSLLVQMQANLHSVTTKPAEYAKQLVRILRLKPDMTISELATKLSKSTDWINARLGLLKLHPEIQKLVDDGSLCLANARMLSSLDEEEQKNWLSRGINEPSEVFVPAIKEFIKEKKKEAREGGAGKAEEVFKAIPRQRTKNDLVTEIEKPTARNSILTKDMTPAQAWTAALQWALRLDPQTIKEAQEKWEADKKARDQRREENRKAREAARAAKAAEIEAKLI